MHTQIRSISRMLQGAVGATALALAGAATPAAGQVHVSIGSGYHHYDRPGHRSISGRHGTVVYDRDYRNGYSRPGFFSYHGYGQKAYRTSSYRSSSYGSGHYHRGYPYDYRRTSVLPNSGVSIITGGSRHRSYYGGSGVYVNTIVTDPCPTPIVRERVIVQQPVVRERVGVERERYGREHDRSPYERGRSLVDDASRAHQAGDYHTARRLYEQSIAHRRSTASARRGLAIVYFETDHVTDGLRLLERAYEEEPTLASSPFDDRILAGDRLSAMIDGAQRRADRESSSRAWLAVAVLRQAAGDRVGAEHAISEAARFGLHRRVVDAFYHALRR